MDSLERPEGSRKPIGGSGVEDAGAAESGAEEGGTDDRAASGVGVVDKSVGLLDALATGPASLAELVEATGLSRPTAHRLARAWEHHGVVGRDEQGRFRLGAHATAWAGAAGSGLLLDAARPVLAELRDATDESAQLYVRDGARRICVAAAERPSGLRDTVPVGASLPLDAGSGGKVILAFEGPTRDGSAEPRGPRRSDADLVRIRKRGWADSVAEREPGVASVSAPVFRDASLVAVVSVSGPIDRLTRSPGKRFAGAVTHAARELERRAGFTPL